MHNNWEALTTSSVLSYPPFPADMNDLKAQKSDVDECRIDMLAEAADTSFQSEDESSFSAIATPA